MSKETNSKDRKQTFNESLLPRGLKQRKESSQQVVPSSLVETVKQEAEQQIQEMIRRARRVAEKEKELARREADSLLRETHEEIETMEQQKRSRHKASLTVKRHVMIEKHKEHLVERFLDDLIEQFRTMPRDDHYSEILLRLIRDAITHLDGDRFTVKTSAADSEFLRQGDRLKTITKKISASDRDVTLSLSDQAVDTAGGAIVEQEPAGGGTASVVFHNTFEEILYRHKEDLLVILFEGLEKWRQYDG